MNFGKWIVVAFVLFAAFIGTLVTVCVKQDVNLVSKTYYKDELAYQDQIVRIANTQGLPNKPVIAKNQQGFQIKFEPNAKITKGEIKLFCPSNPEMDKSFSLALDDSNKQAFDISTLKSGMYKAKLLWTMDGKEYFIEEVIYL